MGGYKKESARKERQSGAGADNMSNIKTKGENFYRSQKKLKTLHMFNSGSNVQRDRSGKITKAAPYQSRSTPGDVARVEPNRKWFGNTRVIAQDSLAQFREAVSQKSNDPYSFLVKSNKLPMSLIRHDESQKKNGLKQHQAKIAVETSPFGETFGPKAKRKRVKLDVGSVEEMAGNSGKMLDVYKEKQDQARLLSGGVAADEESREEEGPVEDEEIATAREPIFSKGQSRRIWNEAYKVIDSSDVIIQVIDARDPEGTRCRHLEKFLREEAPHKHMIFLLNKCDLVPTKVAATWVRTLSTEHPTLAFHASLQNSFGKGNLIQLLRQFSALHSHRAQLSVGLLGYPNVGKSSIINTLRKKKVCKTAPIPGETKVWQYVTLMKRIFLIDAPGVVPPSVHDTDEDRLLRGVVRVENVDQPSQYVDAALSKCQRRHVERTYGITGYEDADDFLDRLARKSGKLIKGGEADKDTVAKTVLNDFMRGKIPWFVPPPGMEEPASRKKDRGEAGEEGARTGDVARLNKAATAEMRGHKRKRAEGGEVEEESQGEGEESVGIGEQEDDLDLSSSDQDKDETSQDSGDDET